VKERKTRTTNSEQGFQYSCKDYTDRLKQAQVQISMEPIGKPKDNGFAERLMRTMKEEVDLSEYTDFHEAYQRIGRFVDNVYSRKRVHSALDYLTPAEFEPIWLLQQPALVLTLARALLCPTFWGHYRGHKSLMHLLLSQALKLCLIDSSETLPYNLIYVVIEVCFR